MNIHIDEHTEELIAAALSTGEFKTAEEFVAALAARWQRSNLTAHSEDTNAFEAFSRHGLIGCMKPGPSDLATNPAHMQGFGR